MLDYILAQALAKKLAISDYTGLENKPSINGITLSGNKTSDDLGIGGVSDYNDLDNKPISLSQPSFTQEDSIGTGAFMGATFTKVSTKAYPITELLGGSLEYGNDTLDLTDTYVQDITSMLSAMGYAGSMCTVITPSGTVGNMDFRMISLDTAFELQMYGISLTAGTYISQDVTRLSLPEVTVVNPHYAANFLPTVSGSDNGKGLAVYGGKWGLAARTGIAGISDYKNIRRMLTSGDASYTFPLWSQIRAFHKEFGEIVFDVVDNDTTNKKLTLLMHECLTGFEMDSSEALVVCASGLQAGTYYFDATLASTYSDWQKAWSWTFTQDVPAGGVLRPEIDLVNWVPLNMRSYASQTAAAPIETVPLSDTQAGTDITSVISASDTNNFDRAVAGSGNYKESAMHKWLTSDDGPGEWWTPSNDFDMPPSYVNRAGFMAGFEEDFIKALDLTTQVCATGHYYENAGYTVDSYYEAQAKFFLPSLTQLCGEKNGYNSESEITEGIQWGAYANAQYGQDNEVLEKHTVTDHTNTTWWWQRSCNPWSPDRFRGVNPDGYPSGNDFACNPFRGLAVACVIKSI